MSRFNDVKLGTPIDRLVAASRRRLAEDLRGLVADGEVAEDTPVSEVIRLLNENDLRPPAG